LVETAELALILVPGEPNRDTGSRGRAVGCGWPSKLVQAGLAPESRPATNAEPRLQSLVFLPILPRCPNEQATDKNGGQEDQ
jgi:hypothetical protein